MNTTVDTYLENLRVGEGAAFERMTVYPVFGAAVSPLTYKVLAEALADGSVEVREKAAASVPELWLENKSDSMILVLDGEEVIGGRQNRIVNASFLIGAKSEVNIPVTCVEHGRWHPTSDRFRSGESAVHSLRAEKQMQVKESLRATGRPLTDQGEVWASVSRLNMSVDAQSPSGAMNAAYETRATDLAEYERRLGASDGALGLVVALNGEAVGADLFDQPETARKLWSKLVRSYAMDAHGGPNGDVLSRDRAEALLRGLLRARDEAFPSIGIGQDVRLEGEGTDGSVLVYESTVVHLAVFRTQSHSSAGRAGMASASQRRRMYRDQRL